MCNLYSMTRNREAILRLFRVSHNRAAAYEPRDAIFPGYQAPVVRKAADGATGHPPHKPPLRLVPPVPA